MAEGEYGQTDLEYVAAGAAVLASGGGGSYEDARSVLAELAAQGGIRPVAVRPYDGLTDACVLAMMGSPDAATRLTLAQLRYSCLHALQALSQAAGRPGCLIAVETGAINSIVPLLAAADLGLWVVDGDGAGRAVPELPQTTYAGSTALAAAPCALGNDAAPGADIETAILGAAGAARIEQLAGGIVAAFGSFSGIALWPSNAGNGHALTGNYLPQALAQARALGAWLLQAGSPPPTAAVAETITSITGRAAAALATNYYITGVTQATSSASLDAGVIRLDDAPDPARSRRTCWLYNLNENLLAYGSTAAAPLAVAPDSICYYAESTGLGFSNASADLAPYYDAAAGKSTGRTVSLIRVAAAQQLVRTAGVRESFATLLRRIGYAGALPS